MVECDSEPIAENKWICDGTHTVFTAFDQIPLLVDIEMIAAATRHESGLRSTQETPACMITILDIQMT
jgi:hypothetical protein